MGPCIERVFALTMLSFVRGCGRQQSRLSHPVPMVDNSSHTPDYKIRKQPMVEAIG